MDVVRNAMGHLNPSQISVLAFDQPLFALANSIQLKSQQGYGEEKLIFFGGLHTKMAVLRSVGDWLRGSGLVQALVQAEFTSAGTADSFLRASHVSQTRRVHSDSSSTLNLAAELLQPLHQLAR